MKERKQVVDCIGGSARLGRAQVGAVRDAIDAGDLIRAELELHEAEALLGVPVSVAELRVALDLRLQGATIAQYRGNFSRPVKSQWRPWTSPIGTLGPVDSR